MESNFDNKDFEQFVKQNADQYRMFPSEKIWKGINNTLHIRRRWYSAGFTLLLLTTAAVTWVMLSPSYKKIIDASKPTISTPKNVIALQQIQKQIIAVVPTTAPTNFQPFIADLNNGQNTVITISSDEIAANPVIKNLPSIDKLTAGLETGLSLTNIPVYNKETVFHNSVPIQNAGTIADDNMDFYLDKNKKVIVADNTITERKDIYPLSIESVINSFSSSVNRKKWLWQVYFAPTISYRKLIENKSFLNSSTSSPLNYPVVYDINSVVTHKPDIGFELGFSAGYPLSKNIRITTGLQFNVSKYDIRAYNYPTEFATVALRNSPGTSSSVSTATNYRNFDGYKTNWLHNLYLSASLPVGMELKLTGDTKNYIGVGGTIQPTYILGDRAYMISADYKNYVEIPQLIRKWNMNTSFEVFAGYTTGKINWKVGPQVRYQLLSSFQKKYPVKEHLFDFGLKVGIMLNQ